MVVGRLLSAADFAIVNAFMALAPMCSALLNALVMLLARWMPAFLAIGATGPARPRYRPPSGGGSCWPRLGQPAEGGEG